MTREEKIRKLKNGSDTAIWAANEIEALETQNADLFYSLTDCLRQLQKAINGNPIDSDMITSELHARICLYNNDSAALGPLINQDDTPVAYVTGSTVEWIQPQAGSLKDRQPLYAGKNKLHQSDKEKCSRALEFAEYMAKKAEEYMEEYNLLEEERLAQYFNNKKVNEKLFQIEENIGEIATQLKIYIYEFRKRNTLPA